MAAPHNPCSIKCFAGVATRCRLKAESNCSGPSANQIGSALMCIISLFAPVDASLHVFKPIVLELSDLL